MTNKATFTFIDLFAGIGGFHHALSGFGGECLLVAEADAKCRQVYRATWPALPSERMYADIRELTLLPNGRDRTAAQIRELVPEHDVLCAGFPCQPFSKSGQQLGVLDQIRGTLFHDIIAIAQARKPRFIILENVRNLSGPRHRSTLDTIISSLRRVGYRVSDEPAIFSPHLLSPDHGGRPQRRERVFILADYVGVEAKIFATRPLLDLQPYQGWDPHSWSIEDWVQSDEEIRDIHKYRLSREDTACLNAWNAFIKGIPSDSLPGFPIWSDEFRRRPRYPRDAPDWKRDFIRSNSEFFREHEDFISEWRQKSWLPERSFTIEDFIPSRRKFEWQARRAQPGKKNRDLWKLAIQFRPSGVRVKPLTYLPTLVAITQNSVIGPKRRFVTPVEAARMQGFPDSVFVSAGIDDATAYRQAGNAVNVGVVRHVAKLLFESGGVDWGDRQRPDGAFQPSTPRGETAD
jgi:DNA (cytosine-5)-methyltransferase 1